MISKVPVDKVTIKKILIDLLGFAKKPNDTQIRLSLRNRMIFLTILLCIKLAIVIILVFPLHYLIEQLLPLQSKTDFLIENTLIVLFLGFVLFAPLLEEFLFRFFLKQSRWGRIFKRRKIWNKIFPFLTYLSCILFGFIHLLNYKNDGFLFYILSPFIILSQLLGGLILAFIRIRLNFLHGFLFHAVWNFIFTIMMPLIVFAFTTPFTDETKIYSLRVQEQPFFENQKSKIIELDIKNGTIFKINTQQYPLSSILDSIYGKEVYYVEPVLVDMKLSSRQGISTAAFKNILAKEYDIY